MTDPPDHTRLRRLVVKAFKSRAVEKVRPGIERIAHELLDNVERAAASGTVDLVESFAVPLPMRVIGDLLGVPPVAAAPLQDRRRPTAFLTQPRRNRRILGLPDHAGEPTDAAKRQDPGSDLLTALIEARDDGDQLSDGELVTTAYLLILAGDEAVSLSRNAFAQISGQIGKRYSYCPTRRGREMDTISASGPPVAGASEPPNGRLNTGPREHRPPPRGPTRTGRL
jgi:cytochrome P450